MYVVKEEDRINEVMEYFGYPRELVECMLKHSKEYFEGIWHAFYPCYVFEYYAAGFYQIRQMSYKQEQVFQKYILDFLDNCGEKVLDYACGVGDYIIYLGQKGHEVYGKEHEGVPTHFLEYRCRKHNVKNNYIPETIPDGYFDNAILTSAIDHIDKPIEFVKHICRITQGKILATPCIDETYDRPTHIKSILKDVPRAFEVINEHNSRT